MQKGGKREPNKNSFLTISGARRNARGQGAYLSAYKQTYMPAYTAFLLPSAKGLTRPASLQAGGAPNLIAPRIPPGHLLFVRWFFAICFVCFLCFLLFALCWKSQQIQQKCQKSVPKTSKMRSQRVLFEAFLGLSSLLGTSWGPRWQKSALGSMILTLKGRFWIHFRVQNGSKIDKKTIQKLINNLIDCWSPKSAIWGPQNLQKWSQDGPSLVKNEILLKSKNPSKTLAPLTKMRVGGSQDELVGLFLPFQHGIKNKIDFWIDF